MVDLYKRVIDGVADLGFPLSIHFEATYGVSGAAFETFAEMLAYWSPRPLERANPGVGQQNTDDQKDGRCHGGMLALHPVPHPFELTVDALAGYHVREYRGDHRRAGKRGVERDGDPHRGRRPRPCR